jgi:hypothetical protein
MSNEMPIQDCTISSTTNNEISVNKLPNINLPIQCDKITSTIPFNDPESIEIILQLIQDDY